MPVINTRESSPARTPKTITNFGTPSPITSNVQVKIGNAAYFSNTQSAYLQVTNSAGSLNFGTNPFTVEFWWFKPSATRPSSFPTIISNFNGSDFGYVANSWVLQENRIDTANRVSLGVPNVNGSGAAFFIAGTTNLAANTWYNIAVTRTGSTWRLFLNGNIEATGTSAASLDGNNNRNLYISQPQSVTWINGYIDELRISNSARYTANYTVDTNAFTNDANTMLLMHMDGANGANVFTDDAGSVTSSVGLNINYGLSSGGMVINYKPIYTNVFTTTSTWTAPAGVNSIDILLIGGGGAGGSGFQGGGGGGAGFVEQTLSVIPGTSYTITIGAGGTAGFTSARTGANSTFAYTSNGTPLLTSIGGGAGGGESNPADGPNSVKTNGGSGGAGCHPWQTSTLNWFNTGNNITGANSIQSSTLGYGIGYVGGNGRGQQNGTYGGVTCNDYILVGGGGGGAGGVGGDWSLTGGAGGTLRGGNGAPGLTSNITGNVYAAGGGGGLRPVFVNLSAYIPGVGGSNIGGNAGTSPTAGAINTGSGGGGMSAVTNTYGGNAAAGGSGICVIRYQA